MSNVDETVTRVADIRARLDRDLTSLESRLAPREVLVSEAQKVGGAALAAVVGLTALATWLRRRRTRRVHDRRLRVQAAEIARVLPDLLAEAATSSTSNAAGPEPGGNGSGRSSRGRGRLLTLVVVALAGAVAGFVAVSRRAR